MSHPHRGQASGQVVKSKSQPPDVIDVENSVGAQEDSESTSQNRFVRKRNPNVKYNDQFLVTGELRSAMSQKVKSVKAKPKPKPAVPSLLAAQSNPKAPPQSAYQRKQDAIEENVIARTSALKEIQMLRWQYQNRLLPDGAQPCPDIPRGVQKSVKESTKLLTDWSQHATRYIGKTCKVYWDGDRTWFYARILYYDSHHDKHFVYYLVDATAEWLTLKDEKIMVAEAIVMVKKGSSLWPAMQFWVSPNCRDVISKMRGYKKGSEFVEYFAETSTGKRDYEFVQKLACHPFSERDKLLQEKKKPNASLLKTMEQATAEQVTVETTINNILNYIRKNVFIINSGESWIGTRVRAMTHTIPWREMALTAKELQQIRLAEAAEERKLRAGAQKMDKSAPTINNNNIVNLPRRRELLQEKKSEGLNAVIKVDVADQTRCVGTIAQYCPSLDMHLVVFDEEFLQPQWVTVEPEVVDVLIGPTGNKSGGGEPSMAFLRSQAEKPIKEYCDMCGCGQEHIDEPELNVNLDAILQTCSVCEHSYHPYCLPKAPHGEPYGEVRHTKPIEVLRQVHEQYKNPHAHAAAAARGNDASASHGDANSTSTQVQSSAEVTDKPKVHIKSEPGTATASAANATGDNHMQIVSVADDDQDASNLEAETLQREKDLFVCWKCIPCDICGPVGSGWQRPHHTWKLSRAQENAPDEERSLCGECIWRFKHQKDFCPVCFKLYPGVDDSNSFDMGFDTFSEPQNAPLSQPCIKDEADGAGDLAASDGSDDLDMMEIDAGGIDTEEGSVSSTHRPVRNRTKREEDAQKPGSEPDHIIIREDSDAMVQCNECSRWVHALCEGIDQVQYEAMTRGTHPVWGDEYLCPICRVSAAEKVINTLGVLDKTSIFAFPVTEAQAKNYYDMIRNPMDLKTMCDKAQRGQYKALQSLRQDFELMCLNAITFNKEGDEYWIDAWAFHGLGMKVFEQHVRQTKMSTYGVELDELMRSQQHKRDEARRVEREEENQMRKLKEDKLQEEIQARYLSQYYANVNKAKLPADEALAGMRTSRSRGRDQVAEGTEADVAANIAKQKAFRESKENKLTEDAESDSMEVEEEVEAAEDESAAPRWDLSLQQKQPDAEVALPTSTLEITLPTQLAMPIEPESYIAAHTMLLQPEDAFYSCAVDQCLLCGSAGSTDLILACIDCGECFHTFCVDAPLSSMNDVSRREWRCTNCKVCEHCGHADAEDISPLLYCEACDKAYHGKCLDIPIDKERAEKIPIWVCEACTVCKDPKCSSKNSIAMAMISNRKKAETAKKRWGASTDYCFHCQDARDLLLKQEQESKRQAEAARILKKREDGYCKAAAYASCVACGSNCASSYVLCRTCRKPSHVNCTQIYVDCDVRNKPGFLDSAEYKNKVKLARTTNDMFANYPSSNKHSSKILNNYCCAVCMQEAEKADPAAYALKLNVLSIQRERLRRDTNKKQTALIEHEKRMSTMFEDQRPILQAVIVWALERAVWLSSARSYDFLIKQIDLSIVDYVNARTPLWLMQRARRFLSLWRHRGLLSKDMLSAYRTNFALCRNSRGIEFSTEVLTRYATMAAAFIGYTQKELDRQSYVNFYLPYDNRFRCTMPHVNFPVINEVQPILHMLTRYANSGSIMAGDFTGIQVGESGEVFPFDANSHPTEKFLQNKREAEQARRKKADELGMDPLRLFSAVSIIVRNLPPEPKPVEPILPVLPDGTTPEVLDPAAAPLPLSTASSDAPIIKPPDNIPPKPTWAQLKAEHDAATAIKEKKMAKETARAKEVALSVSQEKQESLLQILLHMVEVLVTPPCEIGAIDYAKEELLDRELMSGVSTRGAASGSGEKQIEEFKAPPTLPHSKYLPAMPRSKLLSKMNEASIPDVSKQPLPELLKIWLKEDDGSYKKEVMKNAKFLDQLKDNYHNAAQSWAVANNVNYIPDSSSSIVGGTSMYYNRPAGKLTLESDSSAAVLPSPSSPTTVSASASTAAASQGLGDMSSMELDSRKKLAQHRLGQLRLIQQHDIKFISTCPTAGDSLLAVRARKHHSIPISEEEEEKEFGTYDGGGGDERFKYANIIHQNILAVENQYMSHVLIKDQQLIARSLQNDDDKEPDLSKFYIPGKATIPSESILDTTRIQIKAEPGTSFQETENQVTLAGTKRSAAGALVPLPAQGTRSAINTQQVNSHTAASTLAALTQTKETNAIAGQYLQQRSTQVTERERFFEHSKKAIEDVFHHSTVVGAGSHVFAGLSGASIYMDRDALAMATMRTSQINNEASASAGPVSLDAVTELVVSADQRLESSTAVTFHEVSPKRQRIENGDYCSPSPGFSRSGQLATPNASSDKIARDGLRVPIPLRGFGRLNASMPFEETRFCLFCRKPDTASTAELLGRLIPLGFTGGHGTLYQVKERDDSYERSKCQTYAHINCLRWSGEVYEKDNHLFDVNGAKIRAHKTKCSHCQQRGATLICNERSCKRSFHLECAITCNCTLLEALPYKVEKPRADWEQRYSYRTPPRTEAEVEDHTQKTSTELHTFTLCPEHSIAVSILPNAYQKPLPPPPILPTKLNRNWKPTQPRRLLVVHGADAKVHNESIARELSLGKNKRDGSATAVRVGALTVLHIGTPRIDLTGFHTEHHIFPHGFRSARIFWSMTRPMQRTVYVFEVRTEADFEGTDCGLEDYLQRYAINYDPAHKEAFPQCKRTDVEPDSAMYPVFRVSIQDNPHKVIMTRSIERAYEVITDAVSKCNVSSMSYCFKSRRRNTVDSIKSVSGNAAIASAAPAAVAVVQSSTALTAAKSAVPAQEAPMEVTEQQEEPVLSFTDANGNLITTNRPVSLKEYPIGEMLDPLAVACTKAPTSVVPSVLASAEPTALAVQEQVVEPKPEVPQLTYGLNAYHFFGIGMPFVRKAVEGMRESVAASIAPPPYLQYKPVYYLPTVDDAFRLQQLQMSVKVQEPPSVAGSARADGIELIAKRSSGVKVTKLLTKNIAAGERESSINIVDGSGAPPITPAVGTDPNATGLTNELDESAILLERNREAYQQLSAAYLHDPNARLEVRKSHIHNWGLFSRTSFAQNEMIVEYIGEKIRQAVADHREARYEAEGVGSCYLFRLDADEIVDATRTGGMARFMNHCCEPNAYAKIVSTDAEGRDKHIIIFAARDIQAFEEITYDYKFPIEEKKLRCYCGATRCRGSMN